MDLASEVVFLMMCVEKEREREEKKERSGSARHCNVHVGSEKLKIGRVVMIAANCKFRTK